MFRKKARMLILTAMLAGTMVLPVSAAGSDDNNVTMENNQETSMEESNGDGGVNVNKDDLLVSEDGNEGEIPLPDDEKLSEVRLLETGSISVTLTAGKEGTSVEGVPFSCIKVADINGGEYTLTEQYADSGVNLNELHNSEDAAAAAKKLAEIAGAGHETITTDAQGHLEFTELEVGVYLLLAEDTETYDLVTPAVVAIPTWSEDEQGMVYDIDVEPKHTEREEIPAEEPGAPQTNVFSPVYLYFGGAVIVAVVAVTGNIIYRRRKNK